MSILIMSKDVRITSTGNVNVQNCDTCHAQMTLMVLLIGCSVGEMHVGVIEPAPEDINTFAHL